MIELTATIGSITTIIMSVTMLVTIILMVVVDHLNRSPSENNKKIVKRIDWVAGLLMLIGSMAVAVQFNYLIDPPFPAWPFSIRANR